jgi:hypothetical protein
MDRSTELVLGLAEGKTRGRAMTTREVIAGPDKRKTDWLARRAQNATKSLSKSVS